MTVEWEVVEMRSEVRVCLLCVQDIGTCFSVCFVVRCGALFQTPVRVIRMWSAARSDEMEDGMES